jgi:hypothetical protein
MNIRDISSLNRPHFTSFVAIARIVSTSTIISTIMSVIAVVGVIPAYISSRWKKRSMRFKMSISLSRLVLASLAAWGRCQNRLRKGGMHDTDREKDPDSHKNCICRWESLKNRTLEQTFFTTKCLDIHKPNALANGGGKRIQYIDSRDHPFRESIVSILGLIESRDLVSQDGEDSLGGIARLKAGKERVRG